MKPTNEPDNNNRPILRLYDGSKDLKILIIITVFIITAVSLWWVIRLYVDETKGGDNTVLHTGAGLNSGSSQPIATENDITPILCQEGAFSAPSADEVDYNTLMSKDVFVQYIRTALDVFLSNTYATNTEGYDGPLGLVNGIHRKDTAYDDLLTIDKSYLSSKFIVLQSDTAPGGGAWIILIFKDIPDRVFHAWVYNYHNSTGDHSDGFDLRAFGEQTERPSIETVQSAYINQLCDPSLGI